MTKMKLSKRQKTVIVSLIVLPLVFIYALFLKAPNNPPPRPLNVILITIDALRPDHLGCYGYKLDTTPNIGKFAKEGVLFSQAINQGSKTHVSLPSIHTSTYARTHGIYNKGYRLNPLLKTLARTLKDNHYITAGIQYSTRYIPELKQGFDYIFDDPDANKADVITQKAVSWLEKNYQNRFFLWLHYFDTHAPYNPPMPYKQMFEKGANLNRRHVRLGDSLFDSYRAIPLYAAEGNITDIDYYIGKYDGAIRFVDEEIGIVLRKIEELHLDDKTVVVITADHGELLGEHDIYFVHWTLYDENIRVPLVIKCKGLIPPSRLITQQVQSVDIAPTILALLNIPKDPRMQGNSLLSLILGKGGSPSRYAFTELAREENGLTGECVRADGWKLIQSRKGQYEIYRMYNLDLDPGESNNLIDSEKERFGFLKGKLTQWRKRTPAFKLKTYLLSEEVKELLKSLGYSQ